MVRWHILFGWEITSKQMSVVLGHYVNQGLLRRESLSAVHACYFFCADESHAAAQVVTGRGQRIEVDEESSAPARVQCAQRVVPSHLCA